MRRLRTWSVLALGLAALAAPAPAAAAIVDIVIDGSEIRFGVSLPGGIAADVSLEFEEVVGLSAANLGLGVEVINPLNLGFRARMPSGTSLPLALPILLRIEPPASGGLSFSGTANLEIHTHNLLFTALSPLRLFAAPVDGQFEDVTAGMGMGSYRAWGSRGDFSEFIIAIDLRSIDAVARGKFDSLQALLAEHEALITPAVFETLEDLVNAAEADYLAGSYVEAADTVAAFESAVEAASGSDIPDVWRSARDLVNVAGKLRGAADSLNFSIQLRRSSLL
jgi:hypothetical protein